MSSVGLLAQILFGCPPQEQPAPAPDPAPVEIPPTSSAAPAPPAVTVPSPPQDYYVPSEPTPVYAPAPVSSPYTQPTAPISEPTKPPLVSSQILNLTELKLNNDGTINGAQELPAGYTYSNTTGFPEPAWSQGLSGVLQFMYPTTATFLSPMPAWDGSQVMYPPSPFSMQAWGRSYAYQVKNPQNTHTFWDGVPGHQCAPENNYSIIYNCHGVVAPLMQPSDENGKTFIAYEVTDKTVDINGKANTVTMILKRDGNIFTRGVSP